MNDPIIEWFAHWAIPGAFLGLLAVAQTLALSRKGRRLSLVWLRAALVAGLAFPIIAMLPTNARIAVPIPQDIQREPETVTHQTAIFDPLNDVEVAVAEIQFNENSEKPKNQAPYNWVVCLAIIWVTGVAANLFLLIAGHLRWSRAFRDGTDFDGDKMIACRISDLVTGPLLYGVLKPRILLPAQFADWLPEQREAALAHERAHAERGDLVWFYLAALASAIYWWCPPMRLLTRLHLDATEEACDQDAAEASLGRQGYALAMLQIARRIDRPYVASLSMVDRPELARRLTLLVKGEPPCRLFGLTLLQATILSGASIAALANPVLMQPQPVAHGPANQEVEPARSAPLAVSEVHVANPGTAITQSEVLAPVTSIAGLPRLVRHLPHLPRELPIPPSDFQSD